MIIKIKTLYKSLIYIIEWWSMDNNDNRRIVNLNKYHNCINKIIWEQLISTYIKVLIDLAERDNVKFEIWKSWYHIKLYFGKNIKFIVWTDFWLMNYSLARVFNDKSYTQENLFIEWLNTPKSLFIYLKSYDIDEIFSFINILWYPFILKPNDQRGWNWVYKIFDEKQFVKIFDMIQNDWLSNKYIIQEYLEWDEYRLIYLDWEIVLWYKKIPLTIIWDWEKTILELVSTIWIDEEIKERCYSHVLLQSKKIWDILERWEIIQILPVSNIWSWWKPQKINISRNDLTFMKRISSIFWAAYFWIDIISKWDIVNWKIIEINASPTFVWYFSYYPEEVSCFYNKVWIYMKKSC